MIEYLPGVKKLFKTLGIITLVIVVLILIRFNSSYFENKFVIILNGVDINARYESEYRQFVLIKEESENYLRSYNGSRELFFTIPRSEEYILNLYEYEAFNKYHQRESYNQWCRANNFVEVTDSYKTLKIERLDEIIYEGEFINNISDYITEEGRYYFQITVKSKRTDSPISRVYTRLYFNVLVRGEDNDED